MRYLGLLFLILFSLLPQPVLAHAVVTDYSLKSAVIHSHQAGKVEISFNSRIEPGLSQVFLVSKGDKQTALTINADDQPGRIIVQIPGLDEGNYALKFKIFAADGHLTEDVIYFPVVP